MDQGQCHIHGTSHLSELLVGQKASLGGLDSIDAWVVVDSIPAVVVLAVVDPAVADSSPAVEVDLAVVDPAVVDSSPAVEVDLAVVDLVAEVAEVEVVPVDREAYGLAPRDAAMLLLFVQQVKT